MRDYGKISTTIWNSQKFRSLPSDDARLLYFYLHTCPHVNSVGCFVLRDGYAADDLGWEKERYRYGIETLRKANLIGYDRAERLVKIENFLAFDPFNNAKHAKGAIKIALSLPDCRIKLLLLREISNSRFVGESPDLAAAIDTLSIRYRSPEPEPEPDPEPEPNGGGGDAHARAREADPDPPSDAPCNTPPAETPVDTWRETLCRAMGLDPQGITPGGRIAGTQADMAEAQRWQHDLGLSKMQILRQVREVMGKKTGGPPKSFRYFTPAMTELARDLAAPRLEPAPQDQQRNGVRYEQSSSKSRKRIEAFLRGANRD